MLVAAHVLTDAKLFDLLRESNVPTWFSQAQFLAAGAACAAVAMSKAPARTAWILLAATMTFFSLDEVAMLHERLEHRSDTEFVVLVVQPLLGLLLVALIYRELRVGVTGRVLKLLGCGLVALVLAHASSAVSSVTDPTGFAYDLLAVLEEVFEMLTGTFVLVAALTQSSKNA